MDSQDDEPLIQRSDALEFNRFANALLAAASRAMEQLAAEEDPLFKQDLQDHYLELQRIIFVFKTTAGRLTGKDQFDEANHVAFERIQDFVESVRRSHLSVMKIRIPRYRNAANFIFVHPGLQENNQLPFALAFEYLMQSLESALKNIPYSIRRVVREEPPDLEAIKRVIPQQKIAPVQFDVVDGHLTVIDQIPTPKSGSQGVIEASIDNLIENKNQVVSDLKSSNCDRRLLEQVEKLGNLLESGQNIVGLGLENINTRIMASSFTGELPEYLSAKIEGLSSGIAMYLAQFSDWQTFIQNAAEAIIEESLRKSLISSSKNVLDEVGRHSDVVDPSVPKTLLFLKNMATIESVDPKKVTFALMRTVENLVIVTFRYSLDIAKKTMEKTSEKVSDSLSTAIARAVLAIGLAGAAMLLPLSMEVKGLEWVQTTYNFMRQLGK